MPQTISADLSVGAKVVDVGLELGQNPGLTSFVLTGGQSSMSGNILFSYNGKDHIHVYTSITF